MDLEGEPTIQHRRGGLSASATRGAGRMRTKKLLAEAMLDNAMLKDLNAKKW